MSWTLERDELLTQLWRDGLSDAQIAKRIGGISRYSVCGRRTRLKLTRENYSRQSVRRPRTTAEIVRPPQFNPPNQYALEIAPPSGRKKLVDLGDRDCRWPFGDPRSPDFGFCGARKMAGLPYCEIHRRKAFQPPQPVRRAPVVVPVEAPRVVEKVA